MVGLELIAENAEALHLGAGGKELITLELGAKHPVLEHSLGLYHVAIHVPTRADLAQMVVRALQRRVRISPTDHLVSEAIYLWDHDGNGIEITFETPWRGRIGDADEGVYVTHHRRLAAFRPRADRPRRPARRARRRSRRCRRCMPAGTRIGHVHLHVNDLEEAMRFYRDGIGFGGLFIMRRFGMGDLGLDYTPHTIAFNIWAGPNATARAPAMRVRAALVRRRRPRCDQARSTGRRPRPPPRAGRRRHRHQARASKPATPSQQPRQGVSVAASHRKPGRGSALESRPSTSSFRGEVRRAERWRVAPSLYPHSSARNRSTSSAVVAKLVTSRTQSSSAPRPSAGHS